MPSAGLRASSSRRADTPPLIDGAMQRAPPLPVISATSNTSFALFGVSDVFAGRHRFGRLGGLVLLDICHRAAGVFPRLRWRRGDGDPAYTVDRCRAMQVRRTSSIGFSHHSFEKISISQ